jgi:hypothetical protein
MGNDSYPVKLTGTADTTLGSCLLFGISINKATTGTVTPKEGSTALGQFAASTAAGMYWTVPNGARFANLVITLSAADDVTAFVKKA